MKNHESLTQKAIALLNQNKHSLAKRVCNKIVEERQDHFQAHLLLGVINLQENELVSSEKHLNQALANARLPNELAQTYSNLSLVQTQLKRYDNAFASINAAIHYQPKQPLYYCNRANLYEIQQQWIEMKADLEAALTLDASIPELYINLAFAQRKLGLLTDAYTTLLRRPQYQIADWLQEWILVAMLTQRTEQVIEWYQANKQHPSTLIATTDYVLDQGHIDHAKQLYSLLSDFYPENQYLRHQLNALFGITSDKAPAQYVTELFDHCAAEFESRLVGQLNYQLPETLSDALRFYISGPIEKVIDLGCGTGLVGRALKQHFQISQLLGIDLSSNMLIQAQIQGGYDELIQGDVIEALSGLPLSSLITAADVLIYIGEVKKLFQAIHSRLISGGLFVFSTEDCATELQLELHGRYQHSRGYIQSQLAELGFILLDQQACQIRLEKDVPVKGTLFIVKKP